MTKRAFKKFLQEHEKLAQENDYICHLRKPENYTGIDKQIVLSFEDCQIQIDYFKEDSLIEFTYFNKMKTTWACNGRTVIFTNSISFQELFEKLAEKHKKMLLMDLDLFTRN